MKKLKKWITISMAAFFLLIVSQRTLCVSAANGDIASGKDKNITWVIDGSGKLTVKGSGDFTSSVPWLNYRHLIESAVIDVTGMTTSNHFFAYCENLESVDLSKFDTSNITDMSSMFYYCNNLIDLDLSNFNTSNVLNMSNMFNRCGSLTNLDLSSFDTSNVTQMNGMFSDCRNLTSLDLSNFNTKNVTSMGVMFNSCESLTKLDLSNFDTSNVQAMGTMFANCKALIELDISNFNTSNVIVMQGMFGNCNNLTSLNLSNFNTSNVTQMYGMFGNCNNLKNLSLENFDTKNVENMAGMFRECSSLENLNLNNFCTDNIINMTDMFYNCSSLTELDLSTFNLQNLINGVIMEVLDEEEELYEYTDATNILLGCNSLKVIHTPYNLVEVVNLPLDSNEWHSLNGMKFTELPKNLNHSITITRELPNIIEDDNNNNNQTDNDSNNNNDTSTPTPDDPDSDNPWTWIGDKDTEQTGSNTGTLEGTGSTEDLISYGSRLLTITPTAYNKIQLSWDAVPGAKSYEIFYSTSPDSGYKRLANVKKTFYRFSRAKCGITYYFQMRVCQKGAKSAFGPVSYGKTELTGSPSLQVKKTSYNSVTLKWNKVAGAKKYEIFYADSIDGNWHSLGLKGGTSFTHKKLMTGATYYYQIRPIRDSFYGRWSNGVSTTTFLDNVSKLKVKVASVDRMKLTWKKVKGAAYYVILRADSIDGTYEVIAHATKSSYMDTGLSSGTTYFYKIYAVSGPYKTKETAPVGQTTKIAKK